MSGVWFAAFYPGLENRMGGIGGKLHHNRFGGTGIQSGVKDHPYETDKLLAVTVSDLYVVARSVFADCANGNPVVPLSGMVGGEQQLFGKSVRPDCYSDLYAFGKR